MQILKRIHQLRELGRRGVIEKDVAEGMIQAIVDLDTQAIRLQAVREKLYSRAVERFGKIEPLPGKTFRQGYHFYDNTLTFWYHDVNRSSHIEIEEVIYG